MERTGLEPVTPTLPVLCAPNCANAPKTYRNIVKRKMPDCQEFFLLTSGISQNGGNIEKKHISKFSCVTLRVHGNPCFLCYIIYETKPLEQFHFRLFSPPRNVS